MTEDDTFNRLRRASFEDVQKTWHHTLAYEKKSVQYAIEALRKLGWTKEEFYTEFTRRQQLGQV